MSAVGLKNVLDEKGDIDIVERIIYFSILIRKTRSHNFWNIHSIVHMGAYCEIIVSHIFSISFIQRDISLAIFIYMSRCILELHLIIVITVMRESTESSSVIYLIALFSAPFWYNSMPVPSVDSVKDEK